jgi:S-(hydroxymethyl)glutathione dehydrogenase/alcohol dehydrogenase
VYTAAYVCIHSHHSSPARIGGVKIRAAVLEQFGAPLEVQDVELEEPKGGEVLVQLVACGVCHTDLYTASGADPSGYSPTVLGHEGAGVVERVGDGVTSVAPGDHVVTLFSPQCRECDHCRDPRTNLCLAIREQQNQGYLPDGTTRLSRDGEPIRHFMGTSTFAEYTVMPEIALAKVNRNAPLDRACLFACGLSTGLGAAMNTAKVEPGTTCVVFGAGMVGLGAVAGCRLQGAHRIVCVDLSEERLELARGQGATDSLTGGPDAVQQILDLTGGYGADYTFEATGNVQVMRQAVESARIGWGLATVCGVAGKGETLDVVPRFLITGRRVAGSSFGGVKGRDQVPQLVDRYLAGEIDVDPFVSHKLTLDDVNRGFELMEAQDGIRSVIEFG